MAPSPESDAERGRALDHAFVGIRDAGRAIGAGPLSLGRLVVAAIVLGAFVVARREALPPRADLPRLVLFALLWFGAYNVMLNAAEHRIDALVTKNSGGDMTRAKLDAAAAQNIPVVMVARPPLPAGVTAVATVAEAAEWVARLGL